MKYQPIDLSGVKTYPIATRSNKTIMKRDKSGEIRAGMSVAGLLAAMPPQLGAEALLGVIDAVVAAREKGKSVVVAMGAHVIKCGLQPVLRSLVEADIITAFALNGAGSIHDYEISLIGETSEDVGAVLHCGTFGMAEETGRDINRALKEGVADGIGYGEALGRFICQNQNPHRASSLLATCFEKGIPATVHVAVGTDIIHQHPDCDGAVLGQIFGKANLLRSLNPTECLRYALSQPGVHVAICGAGTQGQMEDNIRTARNFKRMTVEEIAETRKRAITGAGVYTGPTLEYWKKKV